MEKEHLHYHAIALATHGNYRPLRKLRGGAGSWEAAYHRAVRSGASLPNLDECSKTLAQTDIRLALLGEKDYPARLAHIAQPPFGIYFRGTLPRADKDIIAIVGTRRASAEGRAIARRIAGELADGGFSVASGLAFGIDTAAHEGCLDAAGATVAVLAGGLDQVYPRSHEALARRILADGGALLSEYPPGEQPFGYRFIERNRIISGIARGVVIVEAPESSGALATARYAAEQDRDLFIVPGPAASASFKGSHSLIRQGAELVTCAGDILESYGVEGSSRALRKASGSSHEETLILTALRETGAPLDVDKISEITKLEPRIVNRTLSLLIIGGTVRESGSGYTI